MKITKPKTKIIKKLYYYILYNNYIIIYIIIQKYFYLFSIRNIYCFYVWLLKRISVHLTFQNMTKPQKIFIWKSFLVGLNTFQYTLISHRLAAISLWNYPYVEVIYATLHVRVATEVNIEWQQCFLLGCSPCVLHGSSNIYTCWSVGYPE